MTLTGRTPVELRGQEEEQEEGEEEEEMEDISIPSQTEPVSEKG